jgi:putative ABC transport system permease protein
MDNLLKDVRYGIRNLIQHKTFTVVAVLTLALGIGANTAIFSVVNAIVLRPLPYPEADRLAMLWGTTTRDGNQEQPFSFAEFHDLQQQARSFNTLTGASPLWNFTLAGDGETEPVQGLFVSANWLELLKVAPAKGRSFAPEEDQIGGTPVVMISHSLWQRRFGADENIVGKSLNLSGTTATIIGVMPASFQFLESSAEVWAPLSQNQFANSGRTPRLLTVVGKLKDGSTVATAAADLKSVAANLTAQYPDSNNGVGYRAVLLHEQVTAKVRPALLLLLGAVLLVLLIACANVVNLLLVKGIARQKELAVRAALGAGRTRLLRQLLTESITLSLIGGVAGVLVANWGVKILLTLNPIKLPQYNKISIDLTVLGFTLFASILTGVIFGFAPAWQTLNVDLHSVLKEGGRTGVSDSKQRRLSGVLVMAEMAMAVVLLIGAGLLIRSFVRLLDVKPGFVAENLLTMQVSLPSTSYAQPQKRIALTQQLDASLRTIPEVSSVGFVTRLPLMSSLNNITTTLNIEGRELSPSDRPEIDFRRASPGYFQTMGIPLLSGRLVTDQDIANNLGLVLINDALAKRFFPGEDPVGKRISNATNNGQTQWQTIVGVVGNVRHLGLDIEPRPEIYYHTHTLPPFGPVVVIRTTSDPMRIISLARAKVRELDSGLAVSNVGTMSDLVSQSVAQRRFGMLLLGIFSGIALLLASIGIYGVVSYSVSQRTREIGVRLALGASARDVLGMILRNGMSLVLAGVTAGLLGAFALTRLMSKLLFEVSATDVLTYAVVSLGLSVIALIACYIPARRAMKVDPMIALRYE